VGSQTGRPPVRVLVADDHTAFRDVLVRVVEAVPEFELVAVVSSGEQAIEQARIATPDLVLMDVRMSGIGGVEAARQIRSERPDVVVVLLTADSGWADRAAVYGVASVIDKRVLSPATLVDAWRAHRPD
jgi:DNA-binding NarL/FixJ family response regulator